ncbi:hypothetical protein Pelo_3005 [Pelomyxa schiedti]|nr:hypothetical protein Pelo_3005 [Pelomyxa schiedti]
MWPQVLQFVDARTMSCDVQLVSKEWRRMACAEASRRLLEILSFAASPFSVAADTPTTECSGNGNQVVTEQSHNPDTRRRPGDHRTTWCWDASGLSSAAHHDMHFKALIDDHCACDLEAASANVFPASDDIAVKHPTGTDKSSGCEKVVSLLGEAGSWSWFHHDKSSIGPHSVPPEEMLDTLGLVLRKDGITFCSSTEGTTVWVLLSGVFETPGGSGEGTSAGSSLVPNASEDDEEDWDGVYDPAAEYMPVPHAPGNGSGILIALSTYYCQEKREFYEILSRHKAKTPDFP